MKAVVTRMLYLVFVIVLGFISIVVATNIISGVDSAEFEAFKIANILSLHLNSLNSLSSGERGRITITFDRTYDIEIKKESEGYYVVATPYTKAYSTEGGSYGEKKGEPVKKPILIYPKDEEGLEKSFTAVKEICVVKLDDPVKKYAEVARC